MAAVLRSHNHTGRFTPTLLAGLGRFTPTLLAGLGRFTPTLLAVILAKERLD